MSHLGCPESLKRLVDCNTHHVLLRALSDIRGSNSISLTSAVVRAFRTFFTSVADVVGPPMWGFQVHTYPDMRLEASSVLEEIFQVHALAYFAMNDGTIMVSSVTIIGHLASFFVTFFVSSQPSYCLDCSIMRSEPTA